MPLYVIDSANQGVLGVDAQSFKIQLIGTGFVSWGLKNTEQGVLGIDAQSFKIQLISTGFVSWGLKNTEPVGRMCSSTQRQQGVCLW
ncbi:hypothetical protein GCM10007169_02110 [Shewanella fodinae]|nr:hypothetical protein GCM10007169_02110 [Shewanella fodinae]